MSKTNEFEQHISDWELSGLSKAAYCKEHNIAYWCFLYHIKRFENKVQGFSQIKINPKSNQINSGGIEYHFADGSYFVFPISCSAGLIRQLIG